MAASTIPPSQWPALLYAPPPTAAKSSVNALPQMQVDDLHYPRQMLLCQGAGYGIGQCMRTVQPDIRVTPANPAERLYNAEVCAAATCLSEHGAGTEQCRYHLERMYKLMNKEKPPEPSMISRGITLVSKLLGLYQKKETA